RPPHHVTIPIQSYCSVVPRLSATAFYPSWRTTRDKTLFVRPWRNNMGWSKHHALGLIYSAPQSCYRGYTLIANNSGGHYAHLVDMEGHICHRWHADAGISYAYLLPNGHLLVRTLSPQDAGPA